VRVRFLTHDASRTGAPLVLLSFLRWLCGRPSVDADLVCWRGGPLLPAFQDVLPTTVVHERLWGRTVLDTAVAGLEELRLPSAGRGIERLAVGRLLPDREVDLHWFNGAGSAVLRRHVDPDAPWVVHLHELATAYDRAVPTDVADGFLTGARRVVAVADRVRDLASGLGVPTDHVAVVPPCLPVVPSLRPGTGERLVGSVGAGSWRKGIDLFVQLAAALVREDDEVRLAWVGRLDDPPTVAADLRLAGVLDRVELVGEVEDARPWVARFGVAVSTAREDPYPLAVVEALAAGVPVVGFDNGGGADLLRSVGAPVVPPLDVAAMAHQVREVLAHPLDLSDVAAHVARDHSIDVVGPRLVDELELALGG